MRAAPSCPRWALLALALPALALPALALPAGRLALLPHGRERGDAELEPGDDARSAALELSTALRFYGAAVRSLYVSAGPGGRGAPLRRAEGRRGRWGLPPPPGRGVCRLLPRCCPGLGWCRLVLTRAGCVSAAVRGRSKELSCSSCVQSGIGAVLMPFSHRGSCRFFAVRAVCAGGDATDGRMVERM